MKTTLFLFCISVIIFSCSKDKDFDNIEGCSSAELKRVSQMDTSYTCTASDNNLSENRYWKYFTLEQLQYCSCLGSPFSNPCLSTLAFRNDSLVGYVEGSDGIPTYTYQIEGDSVKLYHSGTIHTSFYVDPTCEQRLIARDGSKWFQY